MIKLTESAIEALAIKLFQQLGYIHIYAPDISPDGDHPERARYDEVLLTGRLEKALQRINLGMTDAILQTALKEVRRIHSPELLTDNETFHRLLTEGIKISAQHEGSERGEIIRLIDFDNPGHNEFIVANQFTVIENNRNKRPDLVVFVNGIPLVVIELKNAANENASTQSAFRQLETYKRSIPGLFTYNALLVISDGLEAKAGSLSAGFSRFMTWKIPDDVRAHCMRPDGGKYLDSCYAPPRPELETLINGMLNKKRCWIWCGISWCFIPARSCWR
jgi:type I restriction enzyme R subunit